MELNQAIKFSDHFKKEQVQKKQDKFIDENRARGIIIKSLYFSKNDNQFHNDVKKHLAYEHVLFYLDEDKNLAHKIKQDTQFSMDDYHIREEIKQMKNEIRQHRALKNLMSIVQRDENGNPVEGEDVDGQQEQEDYDDFSMSVSFDYGYNDEYGVRDYEGYQMEDQDVENIIDFQRDRIAEMREEDEEKQQELQSLPAGII
ncbi:UNKNOWN [Stylonychia lemnae]|uniref:Uncharacterized protein n=1 Tax=Stylonychia lemnae TaxID=5949 RepID=A0A078A723_STYLE|nr:UNKNOWN [Stylonychia lemnae]|eukprot:CDW76581.1 UNKNOWN [Stylonychia lemnae]